MDKRPKRDLKTIMYTEMQKWDQTLQTKTFFIGRHGIGVQKDTSIYFDSRKHKEWLITETRTLVALRKLWKDQINQTQVQEEKTELEIRYLEANWQVKRIARQDKSNFIGELTTEAEPALG
ncbi:hypothetical protein ElyMa_004351200 [Elysia marginata]|uniref:Uncharacterized protein n=1 Tax=Elysia marginata TaxID=1093978 RepID=A0AAV4H4F9_9GAST|nr:hypothetical protein ElyMa_004351200 [Elysia marginata]